MNRRILIVDDEVQIRELLKSGFSRSGYEVFTVGSGQEALELLKTEQIGVMFLDLKMEGMTGIELCKKIRNDNPVACIFAITAFSSIFELTECREAGFDDYFIKPIRLSELLKVANDAFNRLQRWTHNK